MQRGCCAVNRQPGTLPRAQQELFIYSGENPVPAQVNQGFPIISVRTRSHLQLLGDQGVQPVSDIALKEKRYVLLLQ